MQRLHQGFCAKVSDLGQLPYSSLSDVLLRHRRRCHPTPPPQDRTSHSPVPHHRAYPGVPVSSSRHDDYREYSPELNSRKHPRQSTGSNGDDRNSGARLEEDEEDDDPYGENSHFARQNGMGNGGVYGADQFYNNDSGASYTPHLLPMFQNANVFQQPPNEENHLEDASVLLSMAYPTGMPANEANKQQQAAPENNGQEGVSDWETGQQTINMMMEQARADSNGNTQNGDTATTSADASEDTSPVLTEPLNFIGAMNWLNNQSQKDGGSGSHSWVCISVSLCVCLPITAQYHKSIPPTSLALSILFIHLSVCIWPDPPSRRVSVQRTQ
jgi:hypothetical protein